jgi:hypothetical protein
MHSIKSHSIFRIVASSVLLMTVSWWVQACVECVGRSKLFQKNVAQHPVQSWI